MKRTEARLSPLHVALARRAGLILAACLTVSLAAAEPATAQDNPHGDLSLECSQCHTTAGWTPLRDPLEFEHVEMGLSLEKGHADVDCLSCHQSLVFGFVPSACVDCHEDPHRGELGFDCEVCHSPASWDNRRTLSDFHSATLFPLTGTHATVDCAGCHRREAPFEYALTPTDCLSCHIDDYQSTSEPDHVSAGFPTECQLCHGTVRWEGADFGEIGIDHSAFFPLSGRHAQLDCSDCHAGGFTGTPSDCVACHRAEYNGTRDPNHQQAGFGTQCENCHGTLTWEGAVSDHSSIFPLTGSHRALDCNDCHVSGFAGTPTDCYSCHRDDYNGTRDPNHQSAGFGTDCEDCHDTNGWGGAEVNHQQFWPLTGEHRSLDCDECHASGYAGTPTDCNSCHSDDYDRTTNPDHQDAGFPRDCEACHTTSGWAGASVDHQQFWPLTGQHKNLDCEECHAGGYQGTPTDCNACHSGDYDGTNDPDHQAAGFPRDCEQCHNTGGWDGADFNHSFPIYSGKHRQGEAWDNCSDCHPNAGNFNIFTCTTCHSRSEMDDEHDDVGGYVYNSIDCYECHPTGEEDD